MHARIKAVAVMAAVAAGLAGAAFASSPALATVRPHATTVCFNNPFPQKCLDFSNLLLNQDNAPQFVLNATTGQASIGRRLNLRQASDTRTNEDFIPHVVGTLNQLCPNLNTGAPTGGSNVLDPTSYACLHMGVIDPVYQLNFAPDSNETGQCVGALGAVEGFKLRLVRCGDPRSFWVIDLANSSTRTITHPGGIPSTLVYAPAEFAADRSASNPLVATFVPDSTNPVNKIVLAQENQSGGHVVDRQMWTLTGPAGSPFLFGARV